MAQQDQVNNLAASVLGNLQNQHDWTSLKLHTHASDNKTPHPRPLISGLPPRRIYIHPDDQIKMIKNNAMRAAGQSPETEWVLPMSLNEHITLEFLGSIFDSIERPENLPAGRAKRILLAVIHDDSTIVYYFVHDGIVKPRQN